MIHVTAEDVGFMLKVLDLFPVQRELLQEFKSHGGDLDEDAADLLRDLCGDRLQTHGFDEDYRLTNEGRYLENLIDKLFAG